MDFTSEWLGRYLTHRLGARVRGLSLEKFTRGSSRQTWFGSYRVESTGAETGIVLRTDHPGGSVDPTPLDQEYFIYERLGGAGLPLARALFWEDDPAWTSRPFYLREKIEGSWNIAHYSDPDPRYDDLRIAVAKEHIKALAQVHALDWRKLGFADRLLPPADESDAAPAYIRGVKRLMVEKPGEPIPLFWETCEWLLDRAPRASRICLCKGTNGLGEEVFRGATLVALSDWEEVSISDPASDFAFCQNFCDPIHRNGRQIWGLEQALDYYRAVSGFTITPESVRDYQLIRSLNRLVMMRNAALNAHQNAAIADIRQVWTGTEVQHVVKRSLAAAMGLLPPLPAALYPELNRTVDTL